MQPRSLFDDDPETTSDIAVMEAPAVEPVAPPQPRTEAHARDEALERVLDNAGLSWQDRATAILRSMSASEVTGEDIRLACMARGVHPHHHNAWGGLISRFVSEGLLVATGRYVAMKAKGSHARKTQVYYRRG